MKFTLVAMLKNANLEKISETSKILVYFCQEKV